MRGQRSASKFIVQSKNVEDQDGLFSNTVFNNRGETACRASGHRPVGCSPGQTLNKRDMYSARLSTPPKDPRRELVSLNAVSATKG